MIKRNNALTDVAGIRVGHYTSSHHACGTTVVLCEGGGVGGVDVRGSAPGTRETDLLAPLNLVDKVHAVVLTGGSVYGLSAADGVVRWLSEKGFGYQLEKGLVAPIVPAAALYDLGRGVRGLPPISANWGRRACENANGGPVEMGTAGAGTGAFAGGIKGGIGTASEKLHSGITVAALMAVNSLGTIFNPETGLPWTWRENWRQEFAKYKLAPIRLDKLAGPLAGRFNTTIGVIATDARLDKAQAQKIAQMAQDGLARAIHPAHTMFDGDTIFCLSTGLRPLFRTSATSPAAKPSAVNEIGDAAANCTVRAILHAVFSATSIRGMRAWRDLCQIDTNGRF